MKKCILFIITIVISVTFISLKFNKGKFRTETLQSKYEKLDLQIYELAKSKMVKDDTIKFEFINAIKLVDFLPFYDNKRDNITIESEILKIKDATISYLMNDSEDNLNNYKIILEFRRGNSDIFYYISNFDMDTDEKYANAYDFQYVEIDINNLSFIENFSDSKKNEN